MEIKRIDLTHVFNEAISKFTKFGFKRIRKKEENKGTKYVMRKQNKQK